MKKIIFILTAFSIMLFAIWGCENRINGIDNPTIRVHASGFTSQRLTLADVIACNSNSDCVNVTYHYCPPTRISINKKYLQDYNADTWLHLDLDSKICPNMGFAYDSAGVRLSPACEDAQCVLKVAQEPNITGETTFAIYLAGGNEIPILQTFKVHLPLDNNSACKVALEGCVNPDRYRGACNIKSGWPDWNMDLPCPNSSVSYFCKSFAEIDEKSLEVKCSALK